MSTNVVTGGNIGVLAVSFDGNTDNSFGTLTCNRIGNSGTGIQLLDQQPADSFVPAITAHNSTIQGNGVGIDSDTPAVQDASANWWGCAAGPGNPVCDTVTGNVGDMRSPDGTTCDDGNGCTGPDACQVGVCTGPCRR